MKVDSIVCVTNSKLETEGYNKEQIKKRSKVKAMLKNIAFPSCQLTSFEKRKLQDIEIQVEHLLSDWDKNTSVFRGTKDKIFNVLFVLHGEEKVVKSQLITARAKHVAVKRAIDKEFDSPNCTVIDGVPYVNGYEIIIKQYEQKTN